MKDQLLYLWIEKSDYECFEDAEFNFSPEYTFSFNKETKKIHITKTHMLNIFDDKRVLGINSNISNITAVVGNNGAGKTTLLTTIMKLWKLNNDRLQNGIYSGGCIFITFEHERIKLYNSSSIEGIGIEKAHYYFGSIETIIDLKRGNDFKTKNETESTVVYLSLERKDTSYFKWLMNEKFVPLTPRQIENAGFLFRRNKNPAFIKTRLYGSRFMFEDFLIGLLYAKYQHLLLTRKKDKLKLFFGFINTNEQINKFRTYSGEFLEEYRTINITSNDSIKTALEKVLIFELLLSITSKNQSKASNIIDYFYSEDDCHRVLYNLSSLFDEKAEVDEYINIALEEINHFCELIGNKNIISVSEGIVLNPTTIASIYDIVLNNKYSFLYKYLRFDINGSDGEMAYIRHIAYLFFISDPRIYLYRSKKIINKNILIMLDEADIHLHPEWQRELIMNLIVSINEVFKSKNIQIILTTHSPIVLSDIPPQNIIFIEENGGKKQVYRDFTKETFGANIYDLYNNSFFFNKGVIMGAFAKTYIDKLYSNAKNDKKKRMYNDYINIIGDNNLKKAISEVNNNESTFHTSVEDKIKTIKKNIDYLNQLIKELQVDKND